MDECTTVWKIRRGVKGFKKVSKCTFEPEILTFYGESEEWDRFKTFVKSFSRFKGCIIESQVLSADQSEWLYTLLSYCCRGESAACISSGNPSQEGKVSWDNLEKEYGTKTWKRKLETYAQISRYRSEDFSTRGLLEFLKRIRYEDSIWINFRLDPWTMATVNRLVDIREDWPQFEFHVKDLFDKFETLKGDNGEALSGYPLYKFCMSEIQRIADVEQQKELPIFS